MERYFIWNGVSSSEYGIVMNDRAPIIRPEERVEHVQIPGRPGDLTQLEGDDVYNSYIQSLSISVPGKDNVPAVEAWLSGSGLVTFDTQPNLCQSARVVGVVSFQRHSRNLDWYDAEVQFYCDPIKELISEDSITVTASGTTIVNLGVLPAYPIMMLSGSGAVTITIDGKTLIIPSLHSGWILDCENQWIMEGLVPQMNAWQGEFPVIPTGSSTITFTGNISSITIIPRWRFL